MNRIMELRKDDGAFYPGDGNFEFLSPGETVFLNHPFAGGEHSLILGNISSEAAEVLLPVEEMEGVDFPVKEAVDLLSGERYSLSAGELHLTLAGFSGPLA